MEERISESTHGCVFNSSGHSVEDDTSVLIQTQSLLVDTFIVGLVLPMAFVAKLEKSAVFVQQLNLKLLNSEYDNINGYVNKLYSN